MEKRPIIPIFIIVHNQYEILKKSVESYEKYIKTPFEIVFHNVASTYQPTLDYLNKKREQGYKYYETQKNHHHTVVNSVKEYVSKHPECEYCVITDPDIELLNVNEDILEFYIYMLHHCHAKGVGPMLEINDIPDYYPRKELVLVSHGKQFWNKPKKEVTYKDNKVQYLRCAIDTTFQLFSAKRIPKSFPNGDCIRCLAPYSARHLDWYIDPNNLTDCQKFYMKNTTNISHWNNNKWRGKAHGQVIKPII